MRSPGPFERSVNDIELVTKPDGQQKIMGKQALDQDSSSGSKADLADVAAVATAQQPEAAAATGGFFSFFQRKGSEKRVLAEQIESAKGSAVADQPPKSVPEVAENGKKEEAAVAVEKKEEAKPSTNGKIIFRIPGQVVEWI